MAQLSQPRLHPGQLIPGESHELYQEMLDEAVHEIQPNNFYEWYLVKVLIRSQWMMQRMWDLRDATLRDEIERRRFETVHTDDVGRAADAWRRCFDASGSFEALLRHEAFYERQAARAVEELSKLRGGSLDIATRFPAPEEKIIEAGPDNSHETNENAPLEGRGSRDFYTKSRPERAFVATASASPTKESPPH